MSDSAVKKDLSERDKRIAFLEHYLHGFYTRIERGLAHSVNVIEHIQKSGSEGVDEADVTMVSRSDPMYSVSYQVAEPSGTISCFRRGRPKDLADLASSTAELSPIYAARHATSLVVSKDSTSKVSSRAILNKYHRALLNFDADNGGWFKWPVEDSAAPGYSKVVAKPMDMTTLHGLIKQGIVKDEESFAEHVALIVNNAKLYNRPGDAVYMAAEALDTFARQSMPAYAALK